MIKVALINIKGQSIGLGHSNRIRNLSLYLSKKKYLIFHREFNYNKTNYKNQVFENFLKNSINNKYDIIVLDVSSKSIFQKFKNIKKLIEKNYLIM